MKMLKKLALVSAVSMISAGAFAMDAMDDESMAATTGQDGITINVIPGVLASGASAAAAQTSLETTYGMGVGGAKFAAGTIAAGTFGYKGLHIGQINIHDDDGMTGLTTAGAIVIGTNGDLTDSTVIYADGTQPIVIDVDSVGDGDIVTVGSQAMLNVKITTPTLLGVKTGAIYVASSSDAVTIGDGMQDTVANKTKILDAMHMSVGGIALNIQLGAAEAQGSMIKVTGTLTGGVSIANFALNDAGGTAGISSGGKIAIANLAIKDAGGSNLGIDVGVDAVDGSVNAALNGLVITMTQVGTASGIDIDMEDVALGAAGTADIGDVQLLGLNLNGSKLVIRGH